MSAIFKFLFERATDPLGLPINALYEYIILTVIDSIVYDIAYSKVGDMYHGGLISGRSRYALHTGSDSYEIFQEA